MKEFLKRFNISEDDYENTNLKWKDLMIINSKYSSFILELDPPAKYLVDIFHKVEDVHSVRYRLKSPDKLLAKIIRKKIDDPSRIINLKNYNTEITDLIGLRILHLFKENWENIHKFITDNWDLHEEPIAYYREGDSEEYIKGFENYKCRVERHPYGYRSVHYLIKTKPSKTSYIAEIQVRTIFEEAWSEIDHFIRYPHQLNNHLLNQFLVLFNRLAGSADEMGSFVSRLKLQLALNEQEYQSSIEKKSLKIEELKQEIKDLKLKPKLASDINSNLDEILQMPGYKVHPYNFDLTNSISPDFIRALNPDKIGVAKIFENTEIDLAKIFGNAEIDLAKIFGNIDLSQITNPKKDDSQDK